MEEPIPNSTAKDANIIDSNNLEGRVLLNLIEEKIKRKRLKDSEALNNIRVISNQEIELYPNFIDTPENGIEENGYLLNDNGSSFRNNSNDFTSFPKNIFNEDNLNSYHTQAQSNIHAEPKIINNYEILKQSNGYEVLKNQKEFSTSNTTNFAILTNRESEKSKERGSIMALISVNKYSNKDDTLKPDSSSKTKKKFHHLAREKLATMEFIKKEQSYAQFLNQKYSLEPHSESYNHYDPNSIDDPNLDSGLVKRTMLGLTGLIGSIFQFTNTHSVENELNERFSENHYSLQIHGLNIGQIRKTKNIMFNVCRILHLEKSTLALSIVYYEKLLLLFEDTFNKMASIADKEVTDERDQTRLLTVSRSSLSVRDILSFGGTVVQGFNTIASICLLLAAKINEPTPLDLVVPLVSTLCKLFIINKKQIYENEFFVFSVLEFGLLVPEQEFLPHLYRL
ncbi:CDK5 and ABL1 enzyme substrate 2 [Smittium culicis]|uniref:CDK5 and ABL1 enzyme substrate 2 n=1 Tax=Smittium culicis TaxID=133412 RepID=A0A1R1XYZ6_9FUNG|nr:CDK5 and ABL1 enzyme substrate 2 [Smittium culicis]OMJ19825.1 CDK5 and ABL1 enzyme substrate 2 [Smittium culicis]